MMLLRARDNNIQSFAYTRLHEGNQNEFLKHPKIKWLSENTKSENTKIRKLNYNIIIKHATFIYAISSIRKLVRLAQVVEQWTGNPEVGCSSPPSNHLIFGCFSISF